MINPHLQEKNYTGFGGGIYNIYVNDTTLFMFSNYSGPLGFGGIASASVNVNVVIAGTNPVLFRQFKKTSGITVSLARSSVLCCYVGFIPNIRMFVSLNPAGGQFKSFTLA